ncbi:MAG: hypothetical protein DHS20C18_20150 [Saprospiraceae bacterium]|nr:MAG: hypothetical protein DHS20C18_20150 [Saprospiraceae bacterium]
MSEENKDQEEEYVGNLFSWRFSLFGLALILVLIGIMAYRHYSLGVPFGFSEDAKIEVIPDSLLKPETPETLDTLE